MKTKQYMLIPIFLFGFTQQGFAMERLSNLWNTIKEQEQQRRDEYRKEYMKHMQPVKKTQPKPIDPTLEQHLSKTIRVNLECNHSY